MKTVRYRVLAATVPLLLLFGTSAVMAGADGSTPASLAPAAMSLQMKRDPGNIDSTYTITHLGQYFLYQTETAADFVSYSIRFGAREGHSIHWVGHVSFTVHWGIKGRHNAIMYQYGRFRTTVPVSFLHVFANMRSGARDSDGGGTTIHACKTVTYHSLPKNKWKPTAMCTESDTHHRHHNMNIVFNFGLYGTTWNWSCVVFSPVAYDYGNLYLFSNAAHVAGRGGSDSHQRHVYCIQGPDLGGGGGPGLVGQ